MNDFLAETGMGKKLDSRRTTELFFWVGSCRCYRSLFPILV